MLEQCEDRPAPDDGNRFACSKSFFNCLRCDYNAQRPLGLLAPLCPFTCRVRAKKRVEIYLLCGHSASGIVVLYFFFIKRWHWVELWQVPQSVCLSVHMQVSSCALLTCHQTSIAAQQPHHFFI